MHSIYFDPEFDDGRRRAELYDGQLIVRSLSPASAALVRHAKTMIQEAFGGMDPRTAQYDLSVEEFVARFAPLKTAFIHDPRSKECLRAILAEAHCDPDETYIDVPRLRVATSDGYLTSGVAYAHHPHRDTWYSAPVAQINWWMPVFDYASSAGMAFHPRYWERGVRNGSPSFDYYRWNSEGRAQAKLHVRSDTRVQPKSEEPLELQPEIRLIPRAGGTVLFSAAQLHSTSRNASGMSRWSVDFRTVNLPDVIARRGAPNVDSAPSGTSLRDFVKMRDLSPMPEDVARAYDDREATDGVLVYAGDGEVG
jgi:hypothetical protein